jgi:pimeloyl-ACP methyl ester carboxylesterase
MKEEALLLGSTRSLVGILTEPRVQSRETGFPAVILLNAGLVHRVGPNRLYVKVARSLVEGGLAVLRFDFSGVGDSRARRDHLPFDRSSVLETREAMDALQALRGIDRFLLMGLCSGATASFRTACRDPRVGGAVLVNPRDHLHDRADQEVNARIRSRALARHYWRLALSSSFRAKNAWRAVQGSVDRRSILPMMLRAPLRMLLSPKDGLSPAVAQDLNRLAERGVRLLHVYSEGDEGLDYFRMLLGRELRRPAMRRLLEVKVVSGANHTFTLLWSQDHLVELVREWVLAIEHDAPVR